MKNRKKNKNHYCLFYTCKQKAWNKLRKSFLAQTRRLNDGNDKSGIKTKSGTLSSWTAKWADETAGKKIGEEVGSGTPFPGGYHWGTGNNRPVDGNGRDVNKRAICLTMRNCSSHTSAAFIPASPDPHRFRILELTSARPCYDRTTLFEPSFWRNMCEYVNIYRIYRNVYRFSSMRFVLILINS